MKSVASRILQALAVLGALVVLSAFLFLSACDSTSSSTPPQVQAGDTVTVSGVVASVDLDPLAYDHPAIVVVDTEAGRAVVHVQSQMHLCAASGLPLVFDIAAGDRIKASGTVEADGVVTPCAGASDYLRRAE